MTLQEKIIAKFQNQEAGFKSWLKSYYDTALDLELLKREIGDETFYGWLIETFREDQVDVAHDMLAKLHKTETGKAILKTYALTGEFIFPS